MQSQSEPRVRRRLHCTLSGDCGSQSGLILNLSARGLFVQTSQPAEPGTVLALDVSDPVRDDTIPLQAAVVWRRRVSRRMTGVNQSGMGLRLLTPPAEWEALMTGFLGDATDPHAAPVAEAAEAKPTARFVVRLAKAGGPRSRRVVVESECETDARSEALRRVGSGWAVLEVSKG